MVLCAAYGCSNCSGKVKADGGRIGLFRFPQEPVMKDLWARAVGREDWTPTEDSRLCSEHFTEDQINATYPSRMVLREGAIPTIFTRSRPSRKSAKTPSERSSSASPEPKRRKRKPPAKRSAPSKPRMLKILKEEDPFHIKDYMVVEVKLDFPEGNADTSEPIPTIRVIDEDNPPSEPAFIEYTEKANERTVEDSSSNPPSETVFFEYSSKALEPIDEDSSSENEPVLIEYSKKNTEDSNSDNPPSEPTFIEYTKKTNERTVEDSSSENEPVLIEYSKKNTDEDSDSENPPSERSFTEYSKKDNEPIREDTRSETPRSECDHSDEDHCPLYPTREGCANCFYLKKELGRFKKENARLKKENERRKKDNERLKKSSSSNPSEECYNCETVRKENECLKMRLKLTELFSGTGTEK